MKYLSIKRNERLENNPPKLTTFCVVHYFFVPVPEVVDPQFIFFQPLRAASFNVFDPLKKSTFTCHIFSVNRKMCILPIHDLMAPVIYVVDPFEVGNHCLSEHGSVH